MWGCSVVRRPAKQRPSFTVLKQWPSTHRYGNASTQDFIKFVERTTNRNLDSLFHTWLYQPGKPTL